MKTGFKVRVVLWTILVAIAALGALTPAHSAEPYLSVGKTAGGGYDPVGAASAGVRFQKYGLEATYIAEAPLYRTTLMDHEIIMVTAYRFWTFENRTILWGTPEFVSGLSFKSADRCKHNDETDCNRRMPLPVAFHFGIGVEWKDWRIDLYHDSNDALDHGPEKKNLGVNWLSLTYRFRK